MRRNKLPSLVVVLILTLITVVMWIGFNVYRSLTTKPAPAVPQNILQPLTPTLDTQTLDQINSRIYLNESEVPEIVATAGPAPLGEVTPSPISNPTSLPTSATESASPSPTP